MWIYSQSTGELRYRDGSGHEKLISVGYAGAGEGKNNPALQDRSCVGPLPRGHYGICQAEYHPHKGTLCMRLIPDPDNVMFGRDGFLIHADSIEHPGSASEGCIIFNRVTRGLIAQSDCKRLEVVA